jgi:hypothetical protein
MMRSGTTWSLAPALLLVAGPLTGSTLAAPPTTDTDADLHRMVEKLTKSLPALAAQPPMTGEAKYCIKIYQGDSRGVSGPTADGVYGYSVLNLVHQAFAENASTAWSVEALPTDQTHVFAVSMGCADEPTTQPPAKPDDKPAAKPATPPAAPPSLDELLGIKPAPKPAPAPAPKPDTEKPAIEPSKDAANPDVVPNRDKADLDRLLSAQEMGDAFKQAVALMGDASQRLDHQDPGLDTQRIQEDAIKRLDQLIASLQKKQSKSSSSSQSQQKNSDSKDTAPQQGKQGDKKGQQKPSNGATGKTPGLGPTLQEGALGPQLESARAAWGSLPARVREMLMQGTEDKFSSRYKLLTQEYYKRLAEEASK